MADTRRLVELGMVPPLAKEVATQIDTAAGAGVTSINGEGGVVVIQGVAVPDAAGANPTAGEFDALLESLRGAGLIAT